MTIKEIQTDLFAVPHNYYLAHCISGDYALCPEQKTGKWICIAGDVMCSECKFEVNNPFYLGKGVACPNCGAPMDGGLEEYYGTEE